MPQITRRTHLLLLAIALLIPLIGIVAVAGRDGDSGSEVATGDRDGTRTDSRDGTDQQDRAAGATETDDDGDDESADDGDGDPDDGDSSAGGSGDRGADGTGSGGDDGDGRSTTSTTMRGGSSKPGSSGGATPTTRPAPTSPTTTATTRPPTPPTTAAPAPVRDAAVEGQYLSLLNSRRASEGKTPLSRARCLDTVAAGWAAHLGTTRQLTHNPNVAAHITQHCGAWTGTGENVGWGPNVETLDVNFWNSPPHRTNILGSFSEVGIGVYRSGGSLWICVVFLQQ